MLKGSQQAALAASVNKMNIYHAAADPAAFIIALN